MWVVSFFYPSIGLGLAHVGCFEAVRTAPSVHERGAQCQLERVLTSTRQRLVAIPVSCRHRGWLHLVEQPPYPTISHRRRYHTPSFAGIA